MYMTSIHTSNYMYICQRLEHMLMMILTLVLYSYAKCHKRRGRGQHAALFFVFAF